MTPETRETIDLATAIGARVAPVHPGAKVPAIKNWPNMATRDPAQITQWWDHEYTGCGVCIVTGTTTTGECLFVVDVAPAA